MPPVWLAANAGTLARPSRDANDSGETTIPEPGAHRLLAFIPHPDDESYSFGGTLALASARGWECHVVCASSGEGGERHDGGTPGRDALRDARESELAESCRILGAGPPAFWRLLDGGMRGIADPEGVRRVAEVLAALAPRVVLTLGADGAYGHPDHLALHRWVTAAHAALPEPRPSLLYAAFARGLFLPQYEKCLGMLGDPPSPPREAIGAAPWDYEVDITTVAATKLASIAAHRTQLPHADPHALFPPGIIAALLTTERFTLAEGRGAGGAEALADALGNAPHSAAGAMSWPGA